MIVFNFIDYCPFGGKWDFVILKKELFASRTMIQEIYKLGLSLGRLSIKVIMNKNEMCMHNPQIFTRHYSQLFLNDSEFFSCLFLFGN